MKLPASLVKVFGLRRNPKVPVSAVFNTGGEGLFCPLPNPVFRIIILSKKKLFLSPG